METLQDYVRVQIRMFYIKSNLDWRAHFSWSTDFFFTENTEKECESFSSAYSRLRVYASHWQNERNRDFFNRTEWIIEIITVLENIRVLDSTSQWMYSLTLAGNAWKELTCKGILDSRKLCLH